MVRVQHGNRSIYTTQEPNLNSSISKSTLHGWRLLLATAVVAIAAGASQAAMANPHGGLGGPDGHPGGGRHGMMGGPHQVERMLSSVNATPEQRAQIQQIMQAARTDMKAHHEAGRKLREQSQAVFAQPTVDARAAEALRQQMLAQHDQASKRKMQVMLDVSRVLTPEQRKTLAERTDKRRAMMERHRSERESMERAPR
jgi:Spy/CpxP family protein refolding chaperone